MATKPTYEELEQKVKILEKEFFERKKAEEDLRHQKKRLESLIEYSSLAIVNLDEQHNIISCNRDFEKLFDFKESDIVGRNLDELIAGQEDLGNAISYTKKTFMGKAIHGAGKRRKKDGELIDVEIVGVPVIIDGKLIGAFGIYQDISDRKREEKRIEGLNRLKEALLGPETLAKKMKRITDGVVDILGADFARIWLTRPGDLCDSGCTHAEVNEGPPVCHHRDKCLHLTASSGRYTHMDGAHGRVPFGCYKIGRVAAAAEPGFLTNDVTHDPRVHKHEWARELGLVSFAGCRLVSYDGAPIGVLALFSKQVLSLKEEALLQTIAGTASQVILVNKSLEALRESEEKYRTILERIEDGYYEVDLAGNLTFFNDVLCEIVGYSRDELMGMNNRQFMDKDNARKLYQTFNRVFTTGKPDKYTDWAIVKKDGSKGVVEASVSLRKDVEGEQVVGFRGVIRDISEKQRLEAQLQHAQRMESIGTLAGGIAHNFNNLLMGIMGYASLILLETDSDHPNHKRLKFIEKQVASGSKLTSQLLGYAREGSYEVRPISLNYLVKETSDTFGMAKKEITVHQELSQELYGIKADQGQIEQVLLNLYVNAADAMPGGGDLFLKTNHVADKDMSGKHYKVKPGDYVLLTVRDTGVGMDEETRARIFEPFFTTKGLASGTGLGLASVYGIIKGHGGYIDVVSSKGKGTTFCIYLPASEKKPEETKVLSPDLVKGKGTVLLVDDEEMVLDAGEQLLKYLGYEALLAGDGQEALEIYEKNQDKIDLVLLDMVMPVMGGGKTFDRMKEINPRVKVLLSSGYSIEGEAREILKRGCDAFLQKPFRLEQLSQKIEEILRNK